MGTPNQRESVQNSGDADKRCEKLRERERSVGFVFSWQPDGFIIFIVIVIMIRKRVSC